MRCTHLHDYVENSRILVSQCGGPGSAGVPFFLPGLRQDCHSSFASTKIYLSLKPAKITLFRLARGKSIPDEKREFLFVMVQWCKWEERCWRQDCHWIFARANIVTR